MKRKRVLKSRELARILENHGWTGRNGGNNHVVYCHPDYHVHLSFVSRTGSEVVSIGVLSKIQRLVGLRLRG